MTGLQQGAWVVVADGEKALFLRNVTDAQDPNLEVVRIERQENPPDREQGTDAPGRRTDVGHGQRSAMEETDWHALAKERFAHDLAGILYRAAHRGDYRQLVLVCPARVLGALRPELHDEVRDRLVAEVPQDLTNHPRPEIEAHVVRALAQT